MVNNLVTSNLVSSLMKYFNDSHGGKQLQALVTELNCSSKLLKQFIWVELHTMSFEAPIKMVIRQYLVIKIVEYSY